MRKLLTLAIAVAFATGLVGVATAQTTTTTPEKAPAPKAEKKPAAKTARGTVKSAAADSIVVAGKEKGKDTEWTFAVDPSTKIKKAGKTATAADLAAGDRVQVRYTEDAGKATAQTVTVAKAKKSEAKPTAEKPAEKK